MRPRSLGLACCFAIAWASPVAARCTDPAEPGLAELSARALVTANLEAGHVAAMHRRARVAALLPRVQARVGQGMNDYTRNPDSLDASVVSSDSWRFDVTATFTLDRLIFSPYELRIAEAAGRLSEHRVRLLEQVASAWSARRALDAEAASPNGTDGSGARARETLLLHDRCEQLTVLLATLIGSQSGISLRGVAPRP